MNILVDALPESVKIDGQEYAIKTDFRDCLRTILAFEDRQLSNYEKQMILLANSYEVIPENTAEALSKAMWFLNGGNNESQKEEKDGMQVRYYSFSKDASFIFAAFKQTHGIDLSSTEYLHWWKFIALFMDLGSDTVFCNLVSLRKRLKTGKASKEEKESAAEMGDLLEVQQLDLRTLEQKDKEAEFMALLDGKK